MLPLVNRYECICMHMMDCNRLISTIPSSNSLPVSRYSKFVYVIAESDKLSHQKITKPGVVCDSDDACDQ